MRMVFYREWFIALAVMFGCAIVVAPRSAFAAERAEPQTSVDPLDKAMASVHGTLEHPESYFGEGRDAFVTGHTFPAIRVAISELVDAFQEIVVRRSHAPGEDTISRLCGEAVGELNRADAVLVR